MSVRASQCCWSQRGAPFGSKPPCAPAAVSRTTRLVVEANKRVQKRAKASTSMLQQCDCWPLQPPGLYCTGGRVVAPDLTPASASA